MSTSSTGLYGSATIVNTDIFDDVQALKEQVTTLSTSYLTRAAFCGGSPAAAVYIDGLGTLGKAFPRP